MAQPAQSRAERKEQTRRALLDAALDLLEEVSFGGLSLREVTRRAGIVPTAFYRHFETMDELGVELVEESFGTLREMIRSARVGPTGYESIIADSVAILVRHVHAHRAHFRFIARERSSGVAAVRHAISAELRLFVSELATDLARFPYLAEWSTDDLQMVADLMVGAMVSTAQAILDAPPHGPQAEAAIVRRAKKQLRLIALAVPRWRSS